MAQNDYLQQADNGQLRLTKAGADHLAQLALDCIHQEYPNKLGQVLDGDADLKPPRELHPAFYGCFDWHSAVHGHWMLVKLLKTYPDLSGAEEVRRKLSKNLTKENIAGEVAYFETASKSWERMYGWSWLLKLAEELHTWDDPQARAWGAALAPLADLIADRYIHFLPRQTYPIRTGVHPNTAFGLSFAYDFAMATDHTRLKKVIETSGRQYYLADENCPAAWEPSGEDFLSACLEEANLMRRILSPEKFNRWFKKFLPKKQLKELMVPADVSDRSDPKIVHLDGLNLSRAWSFFGIAHSLEKNKLKNKLRRAANAHLRATLPHVASEHYEGSHWLGSFAVYALTENIN